MSKTKQTQTGDTKAPALKQYKLLKEHTYRREPKKPGEFIGIRQDQVQRLADQGIIDPESAR